MLTRKRKNLFEILNHSSNKIVKRTPNETKIKFIDEKKEYVLCEEGNVKQVNMSGDAFNTSVSYSH